VVRKFAFAMVVLVVAACGNQSDKPKEAAQAAPTEESSAAPATPEQSVAPTDPGSQPVATPDGKATTIDEAVKGAAAAAPAPKAGESAAKPSSAAAGPKAKNDSAPAQSSAAPAPAPGAPSGGAAPTPGDPGAAIPKKAVTAKGQGFTDTTIKIGSTFPLSGPLAFVGQQGAGAIDAYVKLVNARGGIQGRKLQLISYDDGFDPAQVVANVKRLWEQDKVAMIFSFVVDSANEYVKAHNIPYFPFGGSPGSFSSKYPTIFPVGGMFLTWNAESAYAVVNHMNRKPKVVAVMTDSVILNTQATAKYIEQVWKKLGATKVIIEPINMTQGDCSSQVLKYKQEGVEYWDWQSFAFVLCMPAEERLGWRPPLGQGGPVASMSLLSSTIGKSMEGVTAGSPGDLSDGRPRFNGPTKAHLEYVQAIQKYHPSIGTSDHLNSPPTVAWWMASKYVFDGGLNGAAEKFGELSADSLMKWIYEHGKNFDAGIGEPIRGFTPTCKQGNGPTTWWGLWKWDDKAQKLTNNPVSPMLDFSFFSDDPCYMTKVADEVVGAGNTGAARVSAAPKGFRITA
jgi:ABC-type branched-subunit amino acid transport system substrate-binding protein